MKTVLTPQTLACEFTGTSEAHSENQWWSVSYGKLIVYLGRHSLRCLQLILRMRKALILNVHNCHLRLCGKTQSHVGGPSGTEESAFFTVDSLTGGSRGTFWEILALEKEGKCQGAQYALGISGWTGTDGKMKNRLPESMHFVTLPKKATWK